MGSRFGNIVTMEWWNDLWLNEGFATWAGYLCIDRLLVEYNIWTAFVYLVNADVLSKDCLESTQIIAADVQSPSMIDEMFNDIVYNKAACIIRMLNSFMGEKEFQNAIHDYLIRYRYSNASTQDLCSYLSKYSKTSIDEFVENWTKTLGFPLVCITSELNQNGETVLHLKQRRFLASGKIVASGLWQIPISVLTKSTYPAVKQEFLMTTETASVNLGYLSGGWVLVNHDFTSFHRTLYSNEMLKNLSRDLSDLSAIDRLGLLSDAFAMSQAGFTSTETFLNMLQLFDGEKDAYVWKLILDVVTDLCPLLAHTDKAADFRKLVINLCKSRARQLGWSVGKEDDVNTLVCRETVQFIMALMGDEETIKKSKPLFQSKRNGTELPGGLDRAIYTAMATSERNIEDLFSFYEESEDLDEQASILTALSSVRRHKLFKRVLDWSLKKASEDDCVTLLSDLAKNFGSSGRGSQVWKFIIKKKNWQEILERFSDDESMGELLEAVIGALITEKDEKEVRSFFEENPIEDQEESIARGLERLSIQRRHLERLTAEMNSWNFNGKKLKRRPWLLF